MSLSKSNGFFRNAAVIIWRSLRRLCPNCGGASVFSSWFKMKASCPACGMALERNEHGYIVGAYMLNIAIAELVFVVMLVALLWKTWPAPPWDLIMYGGASLMILLPIFFYPFSKTLFLGIDLMFRPAEKRDFGSR